jgi:hypothetical protein
MCNPRKVLPVLLLTLLAGGLSSVATAAQAAEPVITAPQPGEVLQGVITISGTSQVDGFASAEVDFTYTGDQTGTWFVITASSQAVSEEILAVWDTTAISDGSYDLRLRVHLADGRDIDVLVPRLRVRNYTPVETPTPAPTVPEATPQPTATTTPTPYPTPTPLPPNPATVRTIDVFTSFGYGVAAVFVLFIILGIYVWLRRRVP